jgi:DNA-binding NtrC family response regulator
MRRRAMASILVVDDEAGIRELLSDVLRGDGHEVYAAVDGVDALRQLDAGTFDLLITDLRMPGAVDGMDLVRWSSSDAPEMGIIVLTAHGTVDSAVEAMKLGARDYLQKPLRSPAELRMLVADALARRAPR